MNMSLVEPKLIAPNAFDAWAFGRKDAIQMPPLPKLDETIEKKRAFDQTVPILPSLSSITSKFDQPRCQQELIVQGQPTKLPGFDEAFLKVVALQYEKDFPKLESPKTGPYPRQVVPTPLVPTKVSPAFLLPLATMVEENFDAFKGAIPAIIPANPFGSISSFWNGKPFGFAHNASPSKFQEAPAEEQSKKKFKHEHVGPSKPESGSSTTPQFEIVQNPSKFQRRSYSKENRWITPKPTISCCRDRFELGTCFHGQISGNIRVIWTDDDGNPRKDQDGLQGPSKEAAIVQNQAIFLLKSHTSAPSAFRLRFEIQFTMANDPTKTVHNQTVLSNPFFIKTHSRSLKKAIQEEKD